MNIRNLLSEEYIAHYFETRVVPQKFRSSKPDGVYDKQDQGCKWRDIIVDGCVIYTISSMWLDQGGPVDLPEEFRYPWGTYLDN